MTQYWTGFNLLSPQSFSFLISVFFDWNIVSSNYWKKHVEGDACLFLLECYLLMATIIYWAKHWSLSIPWLLVVVLDGFTWQKTLVWMFHDDMMILFSWCHKTSDNKLKLRNSTDANLENDLSMKSRVWQHKNGLDKSVLVSEGC